MTEVRDFCAYEESGGGVGASGNAGAATDAGSGVHGKIGVLFLNRNGITIGGAAGGNGNKTTSRDDAVERAAINGQVFDDRKGFGAPGFEINFVTIFKMAHVKLAYSSALEAAMGFAVDHHAAHTADTFAAIVIKGDRIFSLGDEGFVDNIEHFEKGHVLADVGSVVTYHAALVGGIFLTPDMKSEFHL